MSIGTFPHLMSFSFLGDDQTLISLNLQLLNPLIGEGLAALAERSGFKILNNGQPLNLRCSKSISIVDIEMLIEANGTQIYSKQQLENGRVIIVCNYSQLMHFGHLLPTRIAGLVSSKSRFDTYRRAIKQVAEDRQFIDPQLAQYWGKQKGSNQRQLTARQLQIVRLIASGSSSRQIAAVLGLSPKTVENHRSRILQRIDVRTSAELVLFAEKQGWV